MNVDAQQAFRRGEIIDMNGVPVTPADDFVRNDFRQQEIVSMNADDARSRQMATWGLVGLFATIVLEMLVNHSTNRSSRR